MVAVALRRGRELAESCAFDLSELKYKYPKEMIPDGMTASEFLRHLVRKNLSTRYPRGTPQKVLELLKKELDHDDGELTATMKVRRKAIERKFESEIEQIYGRAG
mgnify:CR=1 FL=1